MYGSHEQVRYLSVIPNKRGSSKPIPKVKHLQTLDCDCKLVSKRFFTALVLIDQNRPRRPKKWSQNTKDLTAASYSIKPG